MKPLSRLIYRLRFLPPLRLPLSFTLIGFILSLTSVWASEDRYHIPVAESYLPGPFLRGKNFWVRASAVTSVIPGQTLGGNVGFGYQRENLGFDLRFQAGVSQLGGFLARPNPLDELTGTAQRQSFFTDLTTPSEYLRGRQDSHLFTTLMAEPGISVAGRLFPEWAPTLQQKARFGLGYGTYIDSANSIGFRALILNFELGVILELGQSPFSIEASCGYHWGEIRNLASPIHETGRLPVLFFQPSLALNYWF
jgi:hypothetical protein